MAEASFTSQNLPQTSIESEAVQEERQQDRTKMDHGIAPSPLLTLLYPVPHVLLTLYLVPLFPYPSVTLVLSAYATFSLLASILGLLGLRLRSPTLLFVFSHHLLLDVFLSLIPQLALLAIFQDFASDSGVCPAPVPVYDAQKSYGKFRVPRSVRGQMTGLERLIGSAAGWDTADWCTMGLQTGRMVAGALVVMGGVAQWRAAMGLRRLAIWYEVKERAVVAVAEKQGPLAGLEKS